MDRYDMDGPIHFNPGEGDWVKYEDHKKIMDATIEVQKILQKKITELEEERDNLRDEISSLEYLVENNFI